MSFSRQDEKHSLRYFLGQMVVAQLPQGSRIDQVCVPGDQCRKGFFRTALGVLLQ